MFYLSDCPFCQKAFKWISELEDENPLYKNIVINKIEEQENAALADTYDYYFVPTFYLEGEKLHEGIATKEKIKEVLDKALK